MWTPDPSSIITAADKAAAALAALPAYAAGKRWLVETGGITVAGAHIQTDRDSQAMITGAYAYAQANPDATINYKAEGGFVALTAAQMTAIGLAVGAHVQACFAAEAAIESLAGGQRLAAPGDEEV